MAFRPIAYLKFLGDPPNTRADGSQANAESTSKEVCLTYRHPVDMVYHIKTTLNIDDTVMAQLKRESVRQGRTMSELVETALRSLFRSRRKPADLSPLPVFHSGGALVDIADRDALYQAMEGR